MSSKLRNTEATKSAPRKRSGAPGPKPTPASLYPPRVFSRCKIAALQAEKNVPLDELTKLCDLTPITTQRIVEGIDLKLSTAFKLADFFGVSVDELWGAGALRA